MMYSKLKEILSKCSADDLEFGLGQNVVALAEYLRDKPSKRDLINIGLSSYGKEILDRKKLRLILLLSVLSEAELIDLGNRLKIESLEVDVIAGMVADFPFRNSVETGYILNSMGLDDSYLPDKIKKVSEESCVMMKSQGIFYEQLDYQFDIRRRVIKTYREMPSSRCILHMPTGAGKTKTAMHIISELLHFDYGKRGYILWMAHSEELLRQAFDAFRDVWHSLGHFDIGLVRLWDQHDLDSELPQRAIIFAGIQKLQSIKLRRERDLETISRGLNLLVVDECHKAPAQKTGEVIHFLLNKKNIFGFHPNLLGLTATPGRKNGYDIEDDKLRMMFDNIKISINIKLMNEYNPGHVVASGEIEILQKRNILSTFKREPIIVSPEVLGLSIQEISKIKTCLGSNDQKTLDKDLVTKIAMNKQRNRLIIDKLLGLNSKNLKTLFFACNVEHAKLVCSALRLEGLEAGLVLGESDSFSKQKTIQEFKDDNSTLNTLINVGVLTTGFDAPNIDCVFISRPVSSVILYSQMIGRGIRGPMMGGKSECLLIDVIDNVDFGDESWAFNYFDNYWK